LSFVIENKELFQRHISR